MTREQLIAQAHAKLGFPTKEVQGRDSLDFKEVHVSIALETLTWLFDQAWGQGLLSGVEGQTYPQEDGRTQ